MIRAFHQPTTLPEALRLVARGGTPVAGATALYTASTRRELTLVDVTRLGLDGVRAKKTCLELGATLTMTELGDAAELPGMPGALLRRAARALGSKALRNAITLGGNVVHPAYWSDMPPALLALDAEVVVQRAGGKPRVVPLCEALAARQPPWRGGLLTAVRVPLRRGIFGFGYERYSRTSSDYALAAVCAVVRSDHGLVRDVRLVVGALQGRPFRVPSAEALLEGQPPTAALLEAASAELARVVRVAPNFRADREYRRKLARVLARRALEAATTWAGREA
jgi:CO/xanthine dehydrogenase FAD-binding subunit